MKKKKKKKGFSSALSRRSIELERREMGEWGLGTPKTR